MTEHSSPDCFSFRRAEGVVRVRHSGKRQTVLSDVERASESSHAFALAGDLNFPSGDNADRAQLGQPGHADKKDVARLQVLNRFEEEGL